MFARSRFQIGPSKQFQNDRCVALRRPPSCARQRPRLRRLLSRPPRSFRSPGIGSLCVGHAFPPSEHILYKCSQRAVQRNSGPGDDLQTFAKRLKALEARLAQEPGHVLTESQVRAMEKAKQEKEAHGEIETAHPGYLGAQDTY